MMVNYILLILTCFYCLSMIGKTTKISKIDGVKEIKVDIRDGSICGWSDTSKKWYCENVYLIDLINEKK